MASEEKKRPYVPPELLAHLKRVFKDQCPHLEMTEKQVWFAAGAAEVVKHLERLHKENLKEL